MEPKIVFPYVHDMEADAQWKCTLCTCPNCMAHFEAQAYAEDESRRNDQIGNYILGVGTVLCFILIGSIVYLETTGPEFPPVTIEDAPIEQVQPAPGSSSLSDVARELEELRLQSEQIFEEAEALNRTVQEIHSDE